MSACNLSPIVSGSPLRGGVSVGHISGSGQAKNVLHKLLFLLPCSLFPFTPAPLPLLHSISLSLSVPPLLLPPATACIFYDYDYVAECSFCISAFTFSLATLRWFVTEIHSPSPSPSSAPPRHWHWWHCNCFVRVRLFTFCSHCLQWECNAVFAHMLIYEFSVDILAMRVKRICGVKKTRTNW